MYDTITDPDEDPSFYYNHSCDPNTWYATATCMVALRDIRPGEHVTYDYACTETEGSMHAGLHCRCGAACCRGTLTFTEWRSHDWQRRFAGHCSAYIERKMAESGWYDPRVVPRYKGGADGFKGMFALASVRRGEPLLVFAGKLVGLDYLLGSDERTRELSLRVNDHLWQVPHPTRGPETPDFINHSCDPNCGLEDSVTVVALRDIVQGEELSIDYGSTNAGVVRTSSDNFSCHCGASICRGVVTCDDWQLLELQQRLWPFFPPFIKRLIVTPTMRLGARTMLQLADLPPPPRTWRADWLDAQTARIMEGDQGERGQKGEEHGERGRKEEEQCEGEQGERRMGSGQLVLWDGWKAGGRGKWPFWAALYWPHRWALLLLAVMFLGESMLHVVKAVLLYRIVSAAIAWGDERTGGVALAVVTQQFCYRAYVSPPPSFPAPVAVALAMVTQQLCYRAYVVSTNTRTAAISAGEVAIHIGQSLSGAFRPSPHLLPPTVLPCPHPLPPLPLPVLLSLLLYLSARSPSSKPLPPKIRQTASASFRPSPRPSPNCPPHTGLPPLPSHTLHLLHRHLLTLTASALSHVSSGHCINLLSNDVRRLDDLVFCSQALWVWRVRLEDSPSLPRLPSMRRSLHSPPLMRFTLAPPSSHPQTTKPHQLACGKWRVRLRAKTAEATDARVKHTEEVGSWGERWAVREGEVGGWGEIGGRLGRDRWAVGVGEALGGILTVKTLALEGRLTAFIQRIRRTEVSFLQWTAAINAVTAALYFSFASVVALDTFATFTCLGGQLTAASVFYVLTLLEIPHYTMGWKVAHGIQQIAEAFVSFKRLSHFLQTTPHGARPQEAPSQNGSALLPKARCYALDTPTTTKPPESTTAALTAPTFRARSLQRFMSFHAAAGPSPAVGPSAAAASADAAGAAALEGTCVTAQEEQEGHVEIDGARAPSGRVEGVSVRVGEAELLGVTGKTGSGKSLLLLGILGEVPLSSGAMHRSVPSLAYASQQVRLPFAAQPLLLVSLSPLPYPLVSHPLAPFASDLMCISLSLPRTRHIPVLCPPVPLRLTCAYYNLPPTTFLSLTAPPLPFPPCASRLCHQPLLIEGTPFLIEGTVRDNILFGTPLDGALYAKVHFMPRLPSAVLFPRRPLLPFALSSPLPSPPPFALSSPLPSPPLCPLLPLPSPPRLHLLATLSHSASYRVGHLCPPHGLGPIATWRRIIGGGGRRQPQCCHRVLVLDGGRAAACGAWSDLCALPSAQQNCDNPPLPFAQLLKPLKAFEAPQSTWSDICTLPSAQQHCDHPPPALGQPLSGGKGVSDTGSDSAMCATVTVSGRVVGAPVTTDTGVDGTFADSHVCQRGTKPARSSSSCSAICAPLTTVTGVDGTFADLQSCKSGATVVCSSKSDTGSDSAMCATVTGGDCAAGNATVTTNTGVDGTVVHSQRCKTGDTAGSSSGSCVDRGTGSERDTDAPTVGTRGCRVGIHGDSLVRGSEDDAEVEQAEVEQAEVEQAEVEQAVVEQAVVEQAEVEQAVVEQAEVEQAVVEQAEVEQAVVEQAVVEQAEVEQAVVEQAVVEQAEVEQAVVEQAVVEQAVVEQAVVEQAEVEQAEVEQAVVEQAEVEQAVVEQAVVEQAEVEQAVVEQAVVEQAVVEQAVVEQAEVEQAVVEQAVVEQAEVEQAEAAALIGTGAEVEKIQLTKDGIHRNTSLRGSENEVLLGTEAEVETAEVGKGVVDACREGERASLEDQAAEGSLCKSREGPLAAKSYSLFRRGDGEQEESGSTEGDEQGLLDVEGWQRGAIPLSVFWGYARKIRVLPLLLFAALFLAAHVSNALVSWFLGLWTEAPETTPHPLVTLAAIALSCVALSLLSSLLIHFAALRASSRMHSLMLSSVLASPLAFFHRNPMGRVLNRFSEDLGVTDDVLPQLLLDFLNPFGLCVAAVVSACIAVPWTLIPMLPLLLLLLHLRHLYVCTAMEVRRMECTTRSVLLARFLATMEGLPTIRAFSQQRRFHRLFLRHVTANASPHLFWIATWEWLGFRLDLLVAAALLSAALAAVALRHSLPPAMAALALSYLLQLPDSLRWALQYGVELENTVRGGGKGGDWGTARAGEHGEGGGEGEGGEGCLGGGGGGEEGRREGGRGAMVVMFMGVKEVRQGKGAGFPAVGAAVRR
ncbi:unnamed protein product [Closterium sp. Naga37s-1]|nr:unnamed protein product [Closterium sp. Naga37s-1]